MSRKTGGRRRRRKGRRGRAEERDGGESEREGEQYTCPPASCNAVLLTKVVVASPPSPTMSPPSLDCCVVWRWEINEEEDYNAEITYLCPL